MLKRQWEWGSVWVDWLALELERDNSHIEHKRPAYPISPPPSFPRRHCHSPDPFPRQLYSGSSKLKEEEHQVQRVVDSLSSVREQQELFV
jgi:hypothetical protein